MWHDIWCVCKDPGGTNGILPVVDCLRKMGHPPLLIANGKAVELLRDKKENCTTFASPIEALTGLAPPRALLTSMCSDGGLGRDLIPHLRAAAPDTQVVSLMDLHGMTLWKEWADRKFRPDHIIDNDEIGAAIIRQAWPDFPPTNIKVLGYPALDKYAGTAGDTLRRSARKKLNLPDGHPIVLYTSQIVGTAGTLRELCEGLRDVGQRDKTKVHLIPRLHPRLRTEAALEYRVLNQALHFFSNGWVWPFTDVCETSELIATADVVVAEWSTTLMEAAALGVTPIAILYRDDGMFRFRRATEGHIAEFPLVSLGCAAKAENRDQLQQLLAEAFSGKLATRLRPVQHQHFKGDGLNARRVAEFVISLTS